MEALQSWETRITAPVMSRSEVAHSTSALGRITRAYHCVRAGLWEEAELSLAHGLGSAIIDQLPAVEARGHLVRANLYRRSDDSDSEEEALQTALAFSERPGFAMTAGDLVEIYTDLARGARRRGDSDGTVRYVVSGFRAAREPWQRQMLRTEFAALMIRHRQYHAALLRYADLEDDSQFSSPAVLLTDLANVCLCHLALRDHASAYSAARRILTSDWEQLRADDNSVLAIAAIASFRSNDSPLLAKAVGGAQRVAQLARSRRANLYARAAEAVQHYALQHYSKCATALAEVLEAGGAHLSTGFMSLLYELMSDAHRDQGSSYLAQSWTDRGRHFDQSRVRKDGFTELLLLETPTLASLTDRQLAIVRLRATGMSNPEIAHSLGIHEATLKTDLRRAATLLGLRSPREIVNAARSAGLL
jgi:DNA-binding NarL/FixJ family response regulator